MNNLKKKFESIKFLCKYIIKYSPEYLFFVLLYQIFCSIEMFFEFTYCKKFLIDLIQEERKYVGAYIYILILIILIIIKLIFDTFLFELIVPIGKEKLHYGIKNDLMIAATSTKIKKFDETSYLNEYTIVMNETIAKMDDFIFSLSLLLGSLTTIIITGAFFVNIDKIGLFFVGISFVITILCNMRRTHNMWAMNNELAPIERKKAYFKRVFYLKQYAEEMRYTHIAKKLETTYSYNCDLTEPIVKRYGNKMCLLTLVADFVCHTFIINICYLSYLVLIYSNHLISLGTVIALLDASTNLKNSLSIFSESVPKFALYCKYAERANRFIKENKKEEEINKENYINGYDININNLSFSYDGKKNVLKNINMKFEYGKKIAIVGENGSGKSTLVKLLLRLYEVDSKKIFIGDIDVLGIDLKSYREMFSCIFQDFNIYSATLGENISMGSMISIDDIQEAINKSGLEEKYRKIEKGIHSQLTKEFDDKGVELSGGEKQKVAISRVFARISPIIIMDEPSSALDINSEIYLNKSLMNKEYKKTIIIITHRLSSIVDADSIYVLKNGKIIETGNHRDLMKKNGYYYDMFMKQASEYNIELE